jgi:hypothetical protein
MSEFADWRVPRDRVVDLTSSEGPMSTPPTSSGWARSSAGGHEVEGGFDLVICNEDLSLVSSATSSSGRPSTTEIILEIFAQHARTHEGRLRSSGAPAPPPAAPDRGVRIRPPGRRAARGVGARGGFGEQQIEVERRRIRKRMRDLDRESSRCATSGTSSGRGRRAERRRRRSSATNAGKSTLLNVLTGPRCARASCSGPDDSQARAAGGSRASLTDRWVSSDCRPTSWRRSGRL